MIALTVMKAASKKKERKKEGKKEKKEKSKAKSFHFVQRKHESTFTF